MLREDRKSLCVLHRRPREFGGELRTFLNQIKNLLEQVEMYALVDGGVYSKANAIPFQAADLERSLTRSQYWPRDKCGSGTHSGCPILQSQRLSDVANIKRQDLKACLHQNDTAMTTSHRGWHRELPPPSVANKTYSAFKSVLSETGRLCADSFNAFTQYQGNH